MRAVEAETEGMASLRLRRELWLFAIFAAFGWLLLPALVYLTGQVLLGEYRPDGGMGRFYADVYGALAGPGPWAWLLLLGPWLLVMAVRLLALPLVHGRARAGDDGEDE
jgi:hypothetical protein